MRFRFRVNVSYDAHAHAEIDVEAADLEEAEWELEEQVDRLNYFDLEDETLDNIELVEIVECMTLESDPAEERQFELKKMAKHPNQLSLGGI